MPLNTLTGPLGKKRAAHLLRRVAFGASFQEIDEFAGLTAQEAFNRLLNENLPDPPLPIDPQTGAEWITTGTTDANSEEFDLRRYLNDWMVGQALGMGVPAEDRISYSFRERLVFFLHTLFTTKQSVVGNSRSIYFQNALFRLYAFDSSDRTIPNLDPMLPDETVVVNLKELTKKVSVDNAMLRFLDGRLNVNGSPNENYARELLELYSIGRGLEKNVPQPEFDGDYFYFTETDVQEGARVLSGFDTDNDFLNIDRETGLPRGVIKNGRHDNGIKQFSQRFGNATIAPDPDLLLGTNSSEESMLDEVSQLVELIYSQDQTPIHICRRLYRFFVYHDVSVELENDIIAEMAGIFVDNNYKIIPVLEALFTSQHFYDGDAGYVNDNFGGLIKSPYDLIIGFNLTFGIAPPDYLGALDTFYEFTDALLSDMSEQGMDLYEPFEVAGYAAYHQFPIYNRSWITTNYLTNRYQFIFQRIWDGQGQEEMGRVNILTFVQDNIPNAVASDPRALIVSLAEYLLPVSENLSFDDPTVSELTQQRLQYFLDAFLYSPALTENPEEHWTNSWQSGDDPEMLAGLLTKLFNALLQTPEYQLM